MTSVPLVIAQGPHPDLRYRAVLFDLFGTLTPRYPLDEVRLTIRAMATDLGLAEDIFEAAWAATFDHRLTGAYASVEENLRAVLEALGEGTDEARIAAAAARRLRFESISVRPRPGVLEALDQLRSMGVRIGLISNCSIETPIVWPSEALQGAVDATTFSCHAGCAKPAREIYLQALDNLGVSPGEGLFVGDGSSDELAGARGCGIDAILMRGADDDETYPGRIARAAWDGATISSIGEVWGFVRGDVAASVRCACC